LCCHFAFAQFIEQGPKLVGSGIAGSPQQGSSIAVSSDGNTLIIGGPDDNSNNGAAWIFTRSDGVWTQQGLKLVGSGAVGGAKQGAAVALSADGNTAIVGGPDDNSNDGAAWVFTRTGVVWTQQGDKLVGSGALSAFQGAAVALSEDGNTAIVGGPGDTQGNGAAWVYTRSQSGWSQQGAKLTTGDVGARFAQSVALSADGNIALLGEPFYNSQEGKAAVFGRSGGVWTPQNVLIGTGAVGNAWQGISVALSADGRTAILGASQDNGGIGTAWIFIRTGSNSWSQQGGKLLGSGAIGASEQGQAVGLSADGNTAMVGGWADNSLIGAAWMFSRSGTVWTQSAKVVGAGNSGSSQQGFSVALSANGQTGALGGNQDNSNVGASWVFVRSRTATHDFNGDHISDIAWRDTSGNVAFWLMNGAAVSTSGGIAGVPGTFSIVGQRDFNGDGNFDLLWHDTGGNTAIWFMNGATVSSAVSVGAIPTAWSVAGTGDFNGDGMGDILWRDSSGNVAVWLMNGANLLSGVVIGNVPLSWNIVGTGDYNGDGQNDLLWRDNLGNDANWFMNGTQVASTGSVGNVPTTWSVVGTGDFNGDGKSDIVWRDTTGNTSIWLMNGASVLSAVGVGSVPTTWSIALVGDYNADGMSDLLWRDNSGNTSMWFMNGAAISSTAVIGNIATTWTVQSVNAE
jgi:VCBS repeat protein